MPSTIILTREQAAARIGVTLSALAKIEADPLNDLIRVAGVRMTHRGNPTIRYRAAALDLWISGEARPGVAS